MLTGAIKNIKTNKTLAIVILFQILFYSGNAGFQPFRVVFLMDRGLSNSLIGIIMTVSSLVAILAQPMWGIISDKIRSIKKVFIFCLICCMILVPLLTAAKGFTGYFIIITLITFFICPFLSFLDMWMVQGLKLVPGNHSYGSVRLWGSVGFMIVVVLLGRLAVVKSVDAVLISYFLMNLIVLAVAIAIPFQGVPPSVQSDEEQENTAVRATGKKVKKKQKLQLGRLIKNYYYITFIVAVCLLNISMRIKMTYLPERMSFAGGDTQVYSLLMSVGALSEVPMFFFSKYILKRFKPITLIMVSMGFAIVHIFLLSMDIPVWTILAIHVLQGFAYSLGVIGNVYYVDSLAPHDLKASAQAIFSASAMGIAGVLGSSIGGFMIDSLGILKTIFIGGVFSSFAFALFAVALVIGRFKKIPIADHSDM